jgi:hypothetical protein
MRCEVLWDTVPTPPAHLQRNQSPRFANNSESTPGNTKPTSTPCTKQTSFPNSKRKRLNLSHLRRRELRNVTQARLQLLELHRQKTQKPTKPTKPKNSNLTEKGGGGEIRGFAAGVLGNTRRDWGGRQGSGDRAEGCRGDEQSECRPTSALDPHPHVPDFFRPSASAGFVAAH